MKINNYPFLFFFTLILTWSCSSTPKAQEKKQEKKPVAVAQNQTKPNILVIHVDDMGYHDLSLTGSKLYDTPTIDKLGTESVQFTNAYASYPRCVPSRYGMFTATYPVNENKGDVASIPENQNLIKQFDKAGYNTYYVGKWHLSPKGTTPKTFGFTDTYAAGAAGGIASRFYPFNVDKKGKPGKYVVPDIEQDSKPGAYAADKLTDATIKFIKNNPKDKPFLAVLAFYAVHTPIEAKEKDIKRNEKELKNIDFGNTPEYIQKDGITKMRQDNTAYAGMVENVDENVAKLLKTLKDEGIADNTIIVFSSDHGGLSNRGTNSHRELATTNYPLRAGKGHIYEGGIKVPLFVKWGNNFKPRVDDQSIILGMDVLPTLLDLATGKKAEGIDGKSYKKVLEGKDTWEDRTVYWSKRKERPNRTGDIKAYVVRSGDYKLIDFFGVGKIELYNLKKDPGENHNLADQMPEKRDELIKLLNQWKKEYLVPEKLNVGGKNKKHKNGKKNKKHKKNNHKKTRLTHN